MGVAVNYPVEVTDYQVTVQSDEATIELKGKDEGDTKSVGIINFRDGGGDDFVNRGGFLSITRPVTLFSAVLHLLQSEKPISLSENGTLSTKSKHVGSAAG